MKLSSEQKTQLKMYLDSGMTLAEIYKRVSDEWNIPLTYMALRFLIDDLGFTFPKPQVAIVAEDPTKQTLESESSEPELMHRNVTVSVDKVVRPGALASGTVIFSDGVNAIWQLDQLGRIGLIPSREGYQPSQEDVREFQSNLQEAMQKGGL